MTIFISWSGSRGYQFAEALTKFVRQVIPDNTVKLFFSADIEPGTLWAQQLDKELKAAKAILLCITRESLHSTWMHYEIGAYNSAARQSRVFAYLLGVQPDELSDPIRKYNALECTEEGTRRLLVAISEKPWQDLEGQFQVAWPKLQATVSKLKQFTIHELIPGFDRLFMRKTFQEPIEECRDQTWLDRHYGARQTIEKLKAELKLTDERWQPYQIAIMHELISEIDGYIREMRRYLIHEVQFKQNDNGKLDFEKPKKDVQNNRPVSGKWSDKRCKKIRQLVSQLLNPKGAPVLAEAPYFISLQPYWYKKAFVHKIEVEIDQGSFILQGHEHETKLCQSSFWDLDRIVFYLLIENSKDPHYEIDILISQVTMEIEKLEVRDDEDTSAMPLHYSIRALSSVFELGEQNNSVRNVKACVKVARQFIKKKKLNEGEQFRKRLVQLLKSLNKMSDK